MGFTPREGLVIHTVAYDDGSRGRRSVAHRLSFVEMVVPYGDPKDPHYRKNAFDAGEDGLGKNCHSLRKVRVFLHLVSISNCSRQDIFVYQGAWCSGNHFCVVLKP